MNDESRLQMSLRIKAMGVLFLVFVLSTALGQKTSSVNSTQTPFPFAKSMLTDKSQESVNGTVVDLWKNPNSKKDGENLSILVLESKNTRLLLQLGPTWQTTEYEKFFKKGQHVSAVGFRFEFRGEPIFLPKEVNVDSTKIYFPYPDRIGFPTSTNP